MIRFIQSFRMGRTLGYGFLKSIKFAYDSRWLRIQAARLRRLRARAK